MSDATTLQVIARVIARPHTVEAVKRILVGMLGPSRAEEWTDVAALEKHAASPHIAGVQPELRALVAQPTQVRKYTLIEQ